MSGQLQGGLDAREAQRRSTEAKRRNRQARLDATRTSREVAADFFTQRAADVRVALDGLLDAALAPDASVTQRLATMRELRAWLPEGYGQVGRAREADTATDPMDDELLKLTPAQLSKLRAELESDAPGQ